MDPEALTFTEIISVTDDRFLACLDLYETAFPPSERLLVSSLISLLKDKSSGGAENQHFLAAINDQGQLVGMALYELIPEWRLALLWYLAVSSHIRNKGFGSRIYQEVKRHIDPMKYAALFFEVEIPEGENQNQAARRIEFYRRNGASLLTGVRYMQHVGWHQPPIPMHIMVHLQQPCNAQQVFELAKTAFQEHLQQDGELMLV